MVQLCHSLLFLLLLSAFCITGATGRASHPRSRARAFVVEQCQATRYPELCVQCLSNHANASAQSQQQLVQYALAMSLARVWYTRAYVSKVAAQLKLTKAKEYQAVKDCLDQINDGVGQLSQSIKKIQRINHDGEGNFLWHTSNVQTWLSNVLTEAMTCIDGFSGYAVGGKVRATIKAKVLNVAHMTSNALALFNRFVTRHRATRSKAQSFTDLSLAPSSLS